jgi:hypothetical protein
LEEDISIYPDGIHDHGTERTHTIVSFIREFGALDGEGNIGFGGCPTYGRQGKMAFAVVGESDPTVRRPTEPQAISWLCRQIGGANFTTLPADATWTTSLPFISAAVGLDFSALEAVQARRLFDEIADDGSARPFRPENWSAAELRDNHRLVPALRAMNPDGFPLLEFAWDISSGVGGGGVNDIVAAEATRVRDQPMSAVTDAAGSQGEPRDVFGDGDPARLCEVPAGALPPVIENWAQDVSERMGAPVAFAVGAALGTLSAAIGAKLRIQPRARDTGWTEPAFLWFAIVEDPGGKKSPVISAATTPIAKLDAERAKEDGKHWVEWSDRKTRRRKGDPDPGPEPRIRRHVVESFTMEALTNVLKGNTAGVLVRQDELTQLIGSLDAYKVGKGSDRPLLLSLIDGREMRVDRAGKGLTYVECWGASVIGGIQPRKIAELARNLDADGLLQRFMPILGDGVRRRGDDREPDHAALRAYDTLVREIAMAEAVSPTPIRLSAAAHEIWAPLGDRIDRLAALPNLSDAWRGHLGKWPGFSTRLLLLMHVIDNWASSLAHAVDMVPVSAATAQRTVLLVEWLLSHSVRFYEECIGVGETGDDARWIAGYVLSTGSTGKVTRRDIGQAKHEFRAAPERVIRAMRYLERMDWCAADDGERVDRFGPSRWVINPLVHQRFAERGEGERLRRERARSEIASAVAERRRLQAGSR